MRHVLMMALAAASSGGGSDVAARKPDEGGTMLAAEQEQRDDEMLAEKQVPVLTAGGSRVYAAESAVADLVRHSGHTLPDVPERDTAPGKLPPNLNEAERRAIEGKREPGDSGVAVGDERNILPPERRLEATNPEQMRKIDEERARAREVAAGGTQIPHESTQGATASPGYSPTPTNGARDDLDT